MEMVASMPEVTLDLNWGRCWGSSYIRKDRKKHAFVVAR
jgi:hypothetical protein